MLFWNGYFALASDLLANPNPRRKRGTMSRAPHLRLGL